jgi:hypothetical protein
VNPALFSEYILKGQILFLPIDENGEPIGIYNKHLPARVFGQTNDYNYFLRQK